MSDYTFFFTESKEDFQLKLLKDIIQFYYNLELADTDLSKIEFKDGDKLNYSFDNLILGY